MVALLLTLMSIRVVHQTRARTLSLSSASDHPIDYARIFNFVTCDCFPICCNSCFKSSSCCHQETSKTISRRTFRVPLSTEYLSQAQYKAMSELNKIRSFDKKEQNPGRLSMTINRVRALSGAI